MKDSQNRRINVRVTEKDLYILGYLRDKLGLSTYKLAKEAIEEHYFSLVKQAENNYILQKK